jgi:hypothetical protein
VSVFLITHVHQKIDKKYNGIVKYHQSINKALFEFKNQKFVLDEAFLSMEKIFGHFDVSKGKINCSKAFNSEVEIYYWMFSEKVIAVNVLETNQLKPV